LALGQNSSSESSRWRACRHRLAQQRGAGRVLAGEQVAPSAVGQADVHVHAGAGQIVERLGHERRLHAVLVGHGFDQALVAHGLVHRLQGVAVFQGDFPWPGAYSEIAVRAGMPCSLQAA
jgi:methylaspartate ammonia-lyase